jgi:hypothetical protein
LVTEALRLHRRYLLEVIERFSICPWAKPAQLEGRTRTHVVTETECDPIELRPLIEVWAADPAVDVAFVIAPLFEGDADAFSAWAASIGELDGNAFFSAPFFPRAPSSASTVHFLRQSPDPTVQLVRRTTLEAVRAQDPPHYTDIFDLDLRDLQAEHPQRTVAAAVLAHNDRTIKCEGRAKLQSILDDIHKDRDKTYARIKGV